MPEESIASVRELLFTVKKIVTIITDSELPAQKKSAMRLREIAQSDSFALLSENFNHS